MSYRPINVVEIVHFYDEKDEYYKDPWWRLVLCGKSHVRMRRDLGWANYYLLPGMIEGGYEACTECQEHPAFQLALLRKE